VDRALEQGAQIITRRGRKAVVVIPYVEYERLRRGGSLAQFLLDSPLAGSELIIERNQELPRELGIEP
jgi:prevent-host-death family protein